MLSLFPPPGPTLHPFSTLLVKGPYHKSAPFHLAIGHVLETPENEVLIISPSQSQLKEKLVSGLDEWLTSSGTSSKVRAAMSRIVILLGYSALHHPA
ncbi:hypothetical protein AN958_07871 [Leucoagaricus sp. SymC.cos]|nr:hypothetical protein AN958_07871 [Leucoagaricus sp. SymC.cos]